MSDYPKTDRYKSNSPHGQTVPIAFARELENNCQQAYDIAERAIELMKYHMKMSGYIDGDSGYSLEREVADDLLTLKNK